ncbi:hypothetical protein B6U74_06320 [Candidatus Bathyarchaeota archaeon ex4484_205]|nr:MAG: hypothetical protein B6U74_06320 [Candidatus Bathyarchaeota archaeon ex4484_205]
MIDEEILEGKRDAYSKKGLVLFCDESKTCTVVWAGNAETEGKALVTMLKNRYGMEEIRRDKNIVVLRVKDAEENKEEKGEEKNKEGDIQG